MDCIYINLEAQSARRAALESNFDKVKADGWRLIRFPAVDADHVRAMNLNGSAKLVEKACFTSHKHLIEANIGRDDPVMILEDDAIFGPRTCRAIEVGLSNIAPDSWDILFTDVCVPNVGAWADIVRMYRVFQKSGELKFVDLSQIQFAGATGYILNPRSIRKISELLQGVEAIEFGYDLYLRDFIYDGILSSSVFIPFVTSVSPLSDQSSIQDNDEGSVGRILDLFRRMVWLDRDLFSHTKTIESLVAAYSNTESRMFGALFEAMISEQLHWN